MLAGGVESMSRVKMGSDGGAWPMDPETSYDTYFTPQGIGADLIATIEGFSRERRRPHSRSVPRRRPPRPSPTAAFAQLGDPGPRPQRRRCCSTMTSSCAATPPWRRWPRSTRPSASSARSGGFDAVILQKYHWVEKIDHVHTPGNSSGVVDGAALVLVGSEASARDLGLVPRARIVATAVSGADPAIMLTGPGPASRKALDKAGLTVEDIDLFEVNEAFASVVMRFCRDMGLTETQIEAKVNVNGGSIALGHPLGATGSMLVGTVVDELHRARPALRPDHHVCRWRDGCCDDRRAGLSLARSRRALPMGAQDTIGTFRWESDADGIVVLTMDDPAGSANTMNTPGRVLHRGGGPPGGREGLHHRRGDHLGEEDLLRRRQPRRHPRHEARGRRGGQRLGRRHEAAPASAGDPRPPGRRGDQRRGPGRWLRDHPGLPPPHRRSTRRAARSACPRSAWACCPAPVASPAPCACWASRTRCSTCCCRASGTSRPTR